MKVLGQIIRILDNRTVIINKGKEDGISGGTVFRILGGPEEIVDPSSGENLGAVTVVKSRVRSQKVYDRFTIAGTSWTQRRTSWEALLGVQAASLGELTRGLTKYDAVDEGELLINPDDVQPWKAQSETPVRVGDFVEAEVQSSSPTTQQEEPEQATQDAEADTATV